MVSIINKLFRDNLVPQQTARGWTVLCTKLIGQKLIDALYEKGDEEVDELKKLLEEKGGEVDKLKKKVMSELKDIKEVKETLEYLGEHVDSLTRFQHIIEHTSQLYHISETELAEAQKIDREDRGSFREGWYVYKLDIPEGDEWHDYFKKKYPQSDDFNL